MRSALRAVADDNRARFLTHHPGDLRDGIDRAQRVRYVTQRYDPGTLVEQITQEIEVDLPVGRKLAQSEPGAFPHCEDLPRDEIRVVIHRRRDDLVTRRDVCHSPRASDQIQAFRGPAREDETIRIAYAEKFRGAH